MPRDLFGGKGIVVEDNTDRPEYIPADKRDIESMLFNAYIILRNDDTQISGREDFESVVDTLEPMISVAKDQLEPQPVINLLTNMLKDESDGEDFSRTKYLTAVVQVLSNLNHADKFVIDIRDWQEGNYFVGNYLKGRPDRLLTLEVYGNLYRGGYDAEYSNFTFHNNVVLGGWNAQHCNLIFHNNVVIGGWYAQHSNFTFHGEVHSAGGWYAQHSNFDLMPGALIEYYQADRSKGNRLRRLNEKGEVMRIPTLWLNLRHMFG